MRNLFWEILARLGFWIPIDKHRPNPKYWDWVLVALREKSSGIFCIPKVAEFRRHNGRWHFDNDDECSANYYYEQCDFVYWHKLPRNPGKL